MRRSRGETMRTAVRLWDEPEGGINSQLACSAPKLTVFGRLAAIAEDTVTGLFYSTTFCTRQDFTHFCWDNFFLKFGPQNLRDSSKVDTTMTLLAGSVEETTLNLRSTFPSI
eukprot:3759483-Rhodomonas_salina.2